MPSSIISCTVNTQHDAPVKSVRWVEAPNYQCAVTGSWDKTLKVRWFYIFLVDVHVCGCGFI